jgi:hypothetical protein
MITKYDNVDCGSSSDGVSFRGLSLNGNSLVDDDAALDDGASLDDNASLDDDASLDNYASLDDYASLEDDEVSDNASSGDELLLDIRSSSTKEDELADKDYKTREGEENSNIHSQDCIEQHGLLEVYIGNTKAKHDPEGKQSKPRQERVSTAVVSRPCL